MLDPQPKFWLFWELSVELLSFCPVEGELLSRLSMSYVWPAAQLMRMARQKLASGNRLFTESPRYTSLGDTSRITIFLRSFSDATLLLMAAFRPSSCRQ